MDSLKTLKQKGTWLKSTQKNITEGKYNWALSHFKEYKKLGGKQSFNQVVSGIKGHKFQKENARYYYKTYHKQYGV